MSDAAGTAIEPSKHARCCCIHSCTGALVATLVGSMLFVCEMCRFSGGGHVAMESDQDN